jgi:predicted Zn-dependent protease with MMP-like domain
VVSKADFADLVERALDELPAQFAEFLDEVPVEIRDRPSADQLARMGIKHPHQLLGLYVGRARTRRSVEDSGVMPDVIYIFQESLERASRSEAELVREVRKTVLHEIGHHFGMGEDDLEKLGYG